MFVGVELEDSPIYALRARRVQLDAWDRDASLAVDLKVDGYEPPRLAAPANQSTARRTTRRAPQAHIGES
jgi:hypothetical protein